MDIIYSAEGKKRILEGQVEEFTNFLLLIPRDKLEALIKHIPKVKGFRSGKDTEIRLKRFFGRSTTWDEKDWAIMLNLWLTHTENTPPIKNALGYKSKKELEEIVKNTMSSKKARREIVEKLIHASHTEDLSQKMIMNWLFFSPFPKDLAAEKLVKMMPKENVFELNEKITSIENALKTLKKDYVEQVQFNSINKNVNKLSTDLLSISNEQKSFYRNLKILTEGIAGCKGDIDKLVELNENQAKEVKALRNSLSKGLESFGSVINDIKDVQAAFNDEKLLNTQLKSAINDLTEELELHKNKIDLFETQFETLNSNNGVENNGHIDNTPKCHPFEGSEIEVKSSFFVENYDLSNEEVQISLKSHEEIIAHLEKNLNYIGIKLPHAKRVAKEVMAGLGSGQLVSFQGSLADLVAKRCATSLTGGKYKLIKVPFGCLDPEPLDEIISDLIKESDKSSELIAIVLEGMNRSAFELYGSSVKQLVIDRSYQVGFDTRSLLLFATIIEGPSVMPAGFEYVELGPLINTNSLKWLDKPSNKEKYYNVDKDTFLKVFSFPPYDHDWDNSILPEWLNLLGGPLWRKVLLNADTQGRRFDPSIDTFLEFTIFGWIIPMIITIDSNKIKDGMEFIENDDRLKYFLIKYAPEAMVTNGIEIY